ncbi:MAG: hypothetical protein WEG36_14470 [Gemmatimonadota bacterium]
MHGLPVVIAMLVVGTLANTHNEAAASRSSLEVTAAPVLASAPTSTDGGVPGTWLCHWGGDGIPQLIFVPTPTIEREGGVTLILLFAVRSHLAHGDYSAYLTSTGPSCE